MRAQKPRQSVGLFRAADNFRGKPWTVITEKYAHKLVRTGEARWVNRNRDVQLIGAITGKLHDLSSRMGPNTTVQAALGNKHHRELARMWLVDTSRVRSKDVKRSDEQTAAANEAAPIAA